MSFGYTARNNTNNVLVSDRTYNTVYAGKAVLQQVFPTINGSTLGYMNAALQFRRFRFDAGGKEVIPFLYNPSGDFGAIAYSQQVGTAIDYYVITPNNVVPTIYCFVKSSSSGKTGWGMSLFDANGKTTFTTGDNILRIKAVYNAVTAFSNVRYDDRYEYYRPYTVAPIQGSAPFNAVGAISKPAVLYNSYGTAECVTPNNSGGAAYWESAARFNFSTKNLETHWFIVAYSGGKNVQTPARDEIAVVIDGADYD